MASRSRAVARLAWPGAGPLALAALLALPARAAAQDSHYWSIQYGPVGQLVGGQLIGGGPDLSATFYNPGALALRNESSYLLSTESVQWELVSTEAQPGLEVLDTSSSTLGAAPSLLAGVLPRWLGEDTRLAWSFLTRQKFQVRLGQRVTDPIADPGARSAAESYFDQRVTESWAGLTLSRPLSESVGLGLTWYGVYRGQRTRSELTFQAIEADGRSAAVAGVTDFDYSHYRTLAKLGLAWQTPAWNAGISVTTPSLSAFGSGKAAYTLSVAGSDGNGDGFPDPPILETASSEDLTADYRSSWAVGMGASRRIGNTRLYASAEWYAAVDRFSVIAVPDDPTEAGRLTQELRQRPQRGDRLRARRERGHIRVRRLPHGLLGGRRRPGRERGRVGLGSLPRERRSVLPAPRQPVHAGRLVGHRRQDASPGLDRPPGAPCPAPGSAPRSTSTTPSSRSCSGSSSGAE